MKFTMDYINNFSKCQKFQPNVFNKSKCQACFKSKDEHSALALENNKNNRKILLCDYYFVAPSSFNFDNPMDRTRRWQRRLFILFDDGELTYSIDENINTVPQGRINLTSGQEISDAEEVTSHKFSIVVLDQSGAKTYIKGANREETEKLKNKLKSIMEGAKPTKVKRNFTISHPPSNSERKVVTSNGILRNFLSHPSISTSDKSNKSRVLSEISNRSPVSVSEVTPIQNCFLDLSYSSSELDRSSLDPLTYRNMRSLKNKSSSPSSNIFIRKSLSLQMLNDAGTSDLNDDILTSTTNLKKKLADQLLPPPDLFSNLPENSQNVTIRSSRSKNKFLKKKNDRARSKSVCDGRDQFPERGSVLGAIGFWEERSRSCDAPKSRRSQVNDYLTSKTDKDGQSRNFSQKIFEFQMRSIESSETFGNHSRDEEYFDDVSLDDIVQQNINHHLFDGKLVVANQMTSNNRTTTNEVSLGSDFLDVAPPWSRRFRSIHGMEDAAEDKSIDRDENRIPNNFNFSKPYHTSSPESKFKLPTEYNKDSCELNLSSSPRDFQQQIEEKEKELINKQNILSVVTSELLKFFHPSSISRNLNNDQYSLSDIQDILKSVYDFFGKTNYEKIELPEALQGSNQENDPLLSNALENLKAQNYFLSSNLAGREAAIERLKVEMNETSNEMETNLQHLKMSLKASEMKRGMLERSHSEMMDGAKEQMRDDSNSSSSCLEMKLERDVLLQKVETSQKKISGLEKDLFNEKLCRESARKSFLKELSDYKMKEAGDKMQLKVLQDDVGRLRIDRSNALSSLNEQNMKISLLADDLSKVERELKETLNQNDQLASMHRDSEQQIKDLTLTLDLQSKRILVLETQVKKLMSENNDLRITLEFNAAEKSCLLEEIDRLNAELSGMQKDKNILSEQLNERLFQRRNEDEELNELKEYLDILEDEMKNNLKIKQEIEADHLRQVHRLECHIAELVEQLKASEKENDDFNDKRNQIEIELKRKSGAFEDLEANSLSRDEDSKDLEMVNEAASSSKQRNNESFPRQTTNLEKDNSSLKRQMRRLEIDLEEVASSSNLKVMELTKRLDLEQRRCARFCDSLKRLSGEDSEELLGHFESLVGELEETKLKLQEAEGKVDDLQKEKLVKNVEDIPVLETYKDKNQHRVEELEGNVQKLELQLKNIQDEHRRELAMQRAAYRKDLALSREEGLKKLEDAEATYLPINEDNIRRKYNKDVNRVKELYNKSLHTLEKSQQQMIGELKKIHQKEMERSRQEKEELLQEEIAATQAALDAMRKAHEAELEKERQKFLDRLSHTYSHADMRALQKRHEEDVKFIEVEMRQLSEEYSMKCLENASISERLKQQTVLLHDNRKRVQEILARNEELVYHLNLEITKLHQILKNISWDKISANYIIDDLKETISKIKYNEDYQLKEQLKNANLRLDCAVEELKELNEKYHNLCKKFDFVRKSSNVSSSNTNEMELDSTLTNSVCSDWSNGDQSPPSSEIPDRRSSKRLTWKFKGKHNKVSFDTRLTLEKSKFVDSGHSITSIALPDVKPHFVVANYNALSCQDSEGGQVESFRDDIINVACNDNNNNKL